MRIEVINPDRADVNRLIDHADGLMKGMYPPESNHLDDLSELSKPNVCFAGAFIDENLAGVGAVKIQSDDGVYGEIKRVFVDPIYRGRRLAITLMQFLEDHLISQGVFIARLETGDKQLEAIGLYKKLGYGICPPYGAYVQDPLSVFMEKNLKP